MNATVDLYFLILAGLAGVGAVLSSWFRRLLRRDHPTVFESLGSPSWLNNSIRNGFLTRHFLVTRGDRGLGDPRLTRVCWFIRVLLAVYLFWFLLPFMAIALR